MSAGLWAPTEHPDTGALLGHGGVEVISHIADSVSRFSGMALGSALDRRKHEHDWLRGNREFFRPTLSPVGMGNVTRPEPTNHALRGNHL